MITTIGTIASVGSIPLAIYLYIKSKETKYEKVKREVIRILSYQIGIGKNLALFEIQSVINSKSRENKINAEKITPNDIIEDLTSEIISNPLIEITKKEFYIENLKSIYTKAKLTSIIENFNITNKKNLVEKEEITSVVEAIMSEEDAESNIVSKNKRKIESLASWFGLTGTIITVVLGLLATRFEKNWNETIYDFFTKNDEITILLISIIATLLTFVFASILRKVSTKKEK